MYGPSDVPSNYPPRTRVRYLNYTYYSVLVDVGRNPAYLIST